MNQHLKKALLYGVWFLIFSPLLGFLVLGVFTMLMMILSHAFGLGLIYFIDNSVGYHFGGGGIGLDVGMQYVIGESELMYSFDRRGGFISFLELLQVFFAILLVDYVIFGLPAFLTGAVFGCYCQRPSSSLISGGAGALFSFIFAFFIAFLSNNYFGFSGFLTNFLQSFLIALVFAVLAFISGALLAFLFKRKMQH